jgi:tetratricopeptide (TPR) repeat protein
VSSKTDQEAIKAYMKATKCDDTRPEPWERLGWIYFDQKYYKPARDRWLEALKRDPSRDDLRENIRSLQAYAESTGSR